MIAQVLMKTGYAYGRMLGGDAWALVDPRGECRETHEFYAAIYGLRIWVGFLIAAVVGFCLI